MHNRVARTTMQNMAGRGYSHHCTPLKLGRLPIQYTAVHKTSDLPSHKTNLYARISVSLAFQPNGRCQDQTLGKRKIPEQMPCRT